MHCAVKTIGGNQSLKYNECFHNVGFSAASSGVLEKIADFSIINHLKKSTILRILNDFIFSTEKSLLELSFCDTARNNQELSIRP